MRRRVPTATAAATTTKRTQSDVPHGEARANRVNGTPSPSTDRATSDDEDELSFTRLLPAVLVSTLVASGTYVSCDEDMAFDVVECTLRTFLQLSLLAAVLGRVMDFAERKNKRAPRSLAAPALVLGYVFGFMLPLAAWEASSRSKLTLQVPGAERIVLKAVTASLAVAVALVGAIALLVIVKPTPRYSPRHAIPICGMLFNNSLSGISLAQAVLFADLASKQRDTIELMLSFGADPFAATRHTFRAALSASLRPQINSMNVIGLVSIPGMMTGTVLAGASPRRAATYQIMIMCLILGANFVSVGVATELMIRGAFDERGGLRPDWIVPNPAPRVSQVVSSLSLSVLAIEGEKEADIEARSLPTKVVLATSDSTKDEDAQLVLRVSLHGSYARGERLMDVDFALPLRGAIAVLEGKSGIGKSTLLRSVTQLHSGFVGTSSVSLAGAERHTFAPPDWRRRVLYVKGDGGASMPRTAHEFIAAMSLSTNAVAELVEAWGMQRASLRRPVSSLSGGEAQRVLLALALAVDDASVLFLDEPSSALDEGTKLLVEASLREKSEARSIVLVTHDDDQKRRLGTMVLTMHEMS